MDDEPDFDDLAERCDLLRLVLSDRRTALGDDHPEVGEIEDELMDALLDLEATIEAVPLVERHLERARARGGALDARDTILEVMLPTLLSEVGRVDEACRSQRSLVGRLMRDKGPVHVDTLDAEASLARLLFISGDTVGARFLEERLLVLSDRHLGTDHPETLFVAELLAESRTAMGDLAGARALNERVVEACLRIFGPEHPDTFGAMSDLAATLFDLGDHRGARELEEKVYAGLERFSGPDDPETLVAAYALSKTLWELGERDRAREMLREALAGMRDELGPDDETTRAATDDLAHWERTGI
jgi:tetratricopeptide (TPR) repeat protein